MSVRTQAELNGMFGRLQRAAARNGAGGTAHWTFHNGSKLYGNSYSIQAPQDSDNFGSNVFTLGFTKETAYQSMYSMVQALESVTQWNQQ